MTIILLIALLLTTFFLRAYPRILLPNAITGDTYFHLYLIKSIALNKGVIPKQDKRFLLNSDCNYPFFYHWLMALFGSNLMYFAERYSSAFFDAVNCFFVFLLANLFFAQFHLSENHALAVALIYALHPILFKTGDEPRVHSGSSRVFVQTLFLAHMTGTYLYLYFDSISGICISVFTGALVFFTAAFGFQVMLFFAPLIAVFFPIYFLIVIAALLMSILITWGRSWRLITTKYHHLVYLYKSKMYYQQLALSTDVKQAVSSFLRLLKLFFTFRIVEFFRTLFLNESPVIRNILGFHALIILFNYHYFWDCKFLYVWMMASMCLFLITKLPGLRIIGKAERYLEYAICPALIVGVLFFSQFSYAIWLLVPYLLFCIIGIYVYNKEYIDNHKGENNDFVAIREMFRKFNDQHKEGIIWTMHPFLYKSMFFTKFPILGYYAGTINYDLAPKQEVHDMLGNYPYPSFDFFDVLNRYQVSYIITTKTYFSNYLQKAKIDENDLGKCNWSKIAESDLMIIYGKA